MRGPNSCSLRNAQRVRALAVAVLAAALAAVSAAGCGPSADAARNQVSPSAAAKCFQNSDWPHQLWTTENFADFRNAALARRVERNGRGAFGLREGVGSPLTEFFFFRTPEDARAAAVEVNRASRLGRLGTVVPVARTVDSVVVSYASSPDARFRTLVLSCLGVAGALQSDFQDAPLGGQGAKESLLGQ